jgi:polyphosphate kinase 2
MANNLARVRVPLKLYEKELFRLQAELVTMAEWIRQEGRRLVVLFEGRDAAGKGSAIARITQYLNPRQVRVAALPKPTPREEGEWYFQRYVAHLPTKGEIVLFDRSWYNRAGVERVMGFATPEQVNQFLRQAPIFEQMLIDDGIYLRKYWFSVSGAEQEKRFKARADDPMRRWKLSPMDLESINRWEDYSQAKDLMFAATDTADSPWYTVESEDKRHSRLNVISHLLSTIPYQPITPAPVVVPARPPAKGYQRPPRADENHYVPDVAAALALAARAKKRAKKAPPAA